MKKKPLLLDSDIPIQDSTLNFPQKLFYILQQRRYPQLINWRFHGYSFQISDVTTFSNEVLPGVFKQSKWGSFQRQLNVYGFKKLSKGMDKGCYFHPYFRQGNEELLNKMKRFSLMKDLLLNADHYYYTKILPSTYSTGHGNSSPPSMMINPNATSTATMTTTNTTTTGMSLPTSPVSSSPFLLPSSSTSCLPPLPPNLSVKSLDHQHHPFELTTNPMIQQQQQQQQGKSNGKMVMNNQQTINGRPISLNSYFLKKETKKLPIPQPLPPLPPVHPTYLNLPPSAFILPNSLQHSEMMMMDEETFPSDRTLSTSMSETSSVTASIAESDSYITATEFSFSLDMLDPYRDPYRLNYARSIPPPPIGMMIGGMMYRPSSEDENDKMDDEETIDRYIVEYFQNDDEDDGDVGLEEGERHSDLKEDNHLELNKIEF